MFIIYALLVVMTSSSVSSDDQTQFKHRCDFFYSGNKEGDSMQSVPVCRKWCLQRGLHAKRIGLWLRRNAYFSNTNVIPTILGMPPTPPRATQLETTQHASVLGSSASSYVLLYNHMA